ncbi:hypothetical protein HQ393_14105 [Chitinibacter bivalviorum]|uniref:Erythromycin esterase family protein n=1 Tax=Chitinibacter bivalviorum TaxID=2739434 RepID=A0A7H9BKT0_9NEIS|nr:hypothetical protein [Chitinibacter bivalviorum]QLG89285.1 hypothetical protein HQ393_14105 [Chitinibacter bivalviorum]
MKGILGLILIISLAACGGGGTGGGGASVGADTSNLKNSIQALSSSSIDSLSDAELANFGKAVGDAKIVVLTEPSHGIAQVMDFNARLIRYLHENKGFDVLLIESGMFDIANMNELKQTKAMPYSVSAPGRVYFGFSRSSNGQKMFAYLDQTQTSSKPMALAGVDVMMEGVASTGLFVSRLEARLQARNAAVLLDPQWNTFKTIAQRVSANPEYTDPPAELSVFNRILGLVKTEFCTAPASNQYSFDSDGFWCRAVNSIGGTAAYVWNTPKVLDYSARDHEAGNNAVWLMDGPFAGKKAILVTHALHGFNTGSSAQESTGSVLANRYGAQIHTTNITAGKVLSPDEVIVRGMLEYELDQVGVLAYMPYPADDSARSEVGKLSIRENNLVSSIPNRFGRAYQSLFYVRQISYITPNWTAYPTVY